MTLQTTITSVASQTFHQDYTHLYIILSRDHGLLCLILLSEIEVIRIDFDIVRKIPYVIILKNLLYESYQFL